MHPIFSTDHASAHISEVDIRQAIERNEPLIRKVLSGKAWNSDWLGWFSVSESCPAAELESIFRTAAYVHARARVLVVIGIGGSNRGAMAVLEALRRSVKSPVRVVFAGDNLSAPKLNDIVDLCRNESVALNVIAKDFNTVEPGVAFRVLRNVLADKYGKDYASRVIVTGSRGSGQLHELAERHGYRFLDFPKPIGGRFSVLSAVGLFPMAVAGVDISRLLGGAKQTEQLLKQTDIYTNPAVRYAVSRNLLFDRGFTMESLVYFEPDLVHFARWWTQLFAETEGKTRNAVFPVSFSYSEDLHAVGQYVQQGRRCITETLLDLFHDETGLSIGTSESVQDGFSYLDGRPFEDLSRAVYAAAREAHSADGVPCLELTPSGPISERTLGELFYFFMFSACLSAALIGVNPFTQEGVESYKRNMYRLLGKKT